MKEMPFFYHDLRARVVPGALILAALGLLDLHVPAQYSSWFSGGETWKAVVIPLILASGSYVFGDTIEALFRRLWEPIGEWAFSIASTKFTSQQQRRSKTSVPVWSLAGADRHELWQWLVVKVSKDYPEAFVHASRFQSEAKMFLNSSIPAFFLFHHIVKQRWPGCAVTSYLVAIVVFMGCLYLSHACEVRRWLQTLATGETLNFPDGPPPPRERIPPPFKVNRPP